MIKVCLAEATQRSAVQPHIGQVDDAPLLCSLQTRDRRAARIATRWVSRFNPRVACQMAESACLLHMVPRYEPLGIEVKIHLLVHPLGQRVAVEVSPSYETGLERQALFTMTTRLHIPAQSGMGKTA